MRKFRKISFFQILALVFVISSCEEVIHLDLKNSAPRTVIEATINATSGECVVLVTKSIGFYEDGKLSKIAGAMVELSTGTGGLKLLQEVSPGVYSAGNLDVKSGEAFRLTVIVSADERYTAETTAPVSIQLDSLKVVRGFGDPRPTSPPVYLINPKWKDPTGTGNFYRFKVTLNNKPQTGSFSITSDEQFDGMEVDMPLYRYAFVLGDTVRLEFQSIDSVSYSYFSQVNDMARPSFVSATPYNPIGNFDNGALGYFGIFHSEVRDLIISSGR